MIKVLPYGFSASSRLPIHAKQGIPRNTFVCTTVPNSLPVAETAKSKSGKLRENNASSPYYKALLPGTDTSHLKKPPVHRSIPAIGFVLESILGLSNNVIRAERFGALYESNFLVSKATFVTKHGAIIDMCRDTETFRSEGASFIFELIFGKDCLIIIDGARHAATRNVIGSAFKSSLFPFYFDAILRRVHATWMRVQKVTESDGRMMLDPVFRNHYLSIIVEMTTGINMDSEFASKICSSFVVMQRSMFSPPYGPVWAAGMSATSELLQILENLVHKNLVENAAIIEKLREYGEKLAFFGGKEIANGDVNVILIAIANTDLKTGPDQENEPAVIESIASLMLLLWLAGYATSAATSSSALLELGLNRNIYEQLAEEQNEIVASAGGDRKVTYEQVNSKMPLLDSYISEILRMHPAAGFLARKTSTDTEICGHLVKAESVVLLDLAAAMRDPDVFHEPNTLKVDRFVKKEGEAPPAKILSFGVPGSPHYCIGGSLSRVLMRTTFSVLLREYRPELDPQQSRKYKIIPEATPVSKVVVTGLTSKLFE